MAPPRRRRLRAALGMTKVESGESPHRHARAEPAPAKTGAGIQRSAGTTLLDPRLALRAPGDDEDGAAFATL